MATPASPAGESQTERKNRTSRSPMPSGSPASTCGMISPGSIGDFIAARKSWSLVPK